MKNCCGKANMKIQKNEIPTGSPLVKAVKRKSVQFVYTGTGALTVLGPVTGKRYRFSRSTAVVSVDFRDAPSFVAVPNIERTKTNVEIVSN